MHLRNGGQVALVLILIAGLAPVAIATFANSHHGASSPHSHIHTYPKGWIKSDFYYYEHTNGADNNCEDKVESGGSTTQGWSGNGCDDDWLFTSVGSSAECRDQGGNNCRVRIRACNQECNHGSCDNSCSSDDQYLDIDFGNPSSSFVSPTPSDGSVQESDFTVDVNDQDSVSGPEYAYYQINDLGRSGIEVNSKNWLQETWEDNDDSGWSTDYDCGWGVGQWGHRKGRFSVRMGDGSSSIVESIDLSNADNIVISYWGDTNSMDSSSERGYLDFYDGSSWHNGLIEHHNDAFEKHSYAIPDDWLSSNNKIRFRLDGSGCGDYFWVDNIHISSARGVDGSFTVDVGGVCQTRTKQECKVTAWTEDQAGNVGSTISRTYTTNYKPSVDSVGFNDDGSQHRFVIDAIVSDQSGDDDISSCTAAVDDGDGNSNSYSMNIDRGYGNSNEARCTQTVSYSDVSGWGHTEQMNIDVTVDDGARSDTAGTYQHSFPNHQPTITSGNSYTDSSSTHEFTVTAVAEDTDAGSGEFQSCQVLHDDNDGNSYTTAGNLDTSYGTTDEAQCSLAIQAERIGGFNGYEPTESIDVRVRFADQHGSTVTTSENSRTIPNHQPTVVESVSFTNSSTRHAFTISAAAKDSDDSGEINSCTANFEDDDGNTRSYRGTLDQSYGSGKEAECTYTLNADDVSAFQVEEAITGWVTFTDDYGASVNTGSSSNTFPNREPVIEQAVSFPRLPDFNLTATIRVNVTDVEDRTVWTNYTVTEDGTTIIDNDNGTKTSENSYELWNSSSFDLDKQNATYEWTATVSDRYDQVTTSGKLIIKEVSPNVTTPQLERPDPWNLQASTFRPGQRFKIESTVSDANGRRDLQEAYANITRPDGTVAASFLEMEQESQVFNGYAVEDTYSIPDNAPSGSWTVTVWTSDREGLEATNTTTFTVETLDDVRLGLQYNITDSDDRWVDGDPATEGTYLPGDVTFPYFASTGGRLLAGIINYGDFVSLRYSDLAGSEYRALMTQSFDDNLFLVPFTKADTGDIEFVEDQFVDGKRFLDNVQASFGYGVGNIKNVRVALNYKDDQGIELRGLNQSLGKGFHKLTLRNEGTKNGKVIIRVER